jgi:hypothetical protein
MGDEMHGGHDDACLNIVTEICTIYLMHLFDHILARARDSNPQTSADR